MLLYYLLFVLIQIILLFWVKQDFQQEEIKLNKCNNKNAFNKEKCLNGRWAQMEI